jgi:hypothetical protein
MRCGGYNFMTELSKTYNLRPIHEPKELLNINDYKSNGFLVIPHSGGTYHNGVCVKLLCDWPTDDTDRIVEYSSQFDYVFLLNRKNLEEHFKSIYVIHEFTKNKIVPWYWDENIEKSDDFSKKEAAYKSWLENKTRLLNELSDKLNKEVLYYEDLYYNTESCDLQGLEFKVDTSKKLYKKDKTEVDAKKSII